MRSNCLAKSQILANEYNKYVRLRPLYQVLVPVLYNVLTVGGNFTLKKTTWIKMPLVRDKSLRKLKNMKKKKKTLKSKSKLENEPGMINHRTSTIVIINLLYQ